MKNRIMIVRGENEPLTKDDTRELYSFLVLTGGNYRNSIYVECDEKTSYLMIADREAKPVLFPINKFYELTGEYPQKDEMCGVMSREVFENMYRGWLVWNADNADCPVCSMYKQKTEV